MMKKENIPVTGHRVNDAPESASTSTLGAATKGVESEMEILESGGGSRNSESGNTENDVVQAVEVTKKKRTPTKHDIASKVKYVSKYETPSRRPASIRSASFNPLAWVADGVTGAIEEVKHNDLGLSQEFWKHLYAVRREGLLTAQALVESLIAKVESKSEQQNDRKKRRERRGNIDIDF